MRIIGEYSLVLHFLDQPGDLTQAAQFKYRPVEPMIPITVLLPVLGSAVKLLVGGRGPSEGEWNSEVTGILSALLAQRDETNATLSRIEEKLDGLALQDFKHSYGAALNRLEDATPKHRDPAERERMLATARDQLGRALVATDDPLAKAMTEWYLGIAWLLSRSKLDCDRRMQQAADYSFTALVQATNDWVPSRGDPRYLAKVRSLETGIDRLGQLFVGRPSERIDAEANLLLRRELAPRVREAEETFDAIRDTRKALGTAEAECPAVRLWPTLEQDPIRRFGLPENFPEGSLKLIVDLEAGRSARLGAFDVGVLTIGVPPQPKTGKTLVDAEFALTNRSSEEQRFELFGLHSKQIEQPARKDKSKLPMRPHLREDIGSIFDLPGALEASADGDEHSPPLSGPQLMANGSYYPKKGSIRLRPGQSTRGWVRFAIAEVPAAIAVTLEGKAKHVQFIRSL